MAKPGLVSAEMISIQENRALAQEMGALSVPKTFIGDSPTSEGLEPEERFIESLMLGKQALAFTNAADADKRAFDIIILGGGPSGLTAAIYAKRSGLDTVILERATVGGQVSLTPAVENYPGFPKIAGYTLVEMMARQAMEYVPIFQGCEVSAVRRAGERIEVETSLGVFTSRALIIATGASHRKLNAPGEDLFSGRGVSYCTTCDGYLYKDGQHVVIVGGGNSALTDALYLDSLGAKVTIVHRGDAFTGEEHLIKSVRDRGTIRTIFDHHVVAMEGKEKLERVVVESKDGKRQALPADGAFVAIGYAPNTAIPKQLGLELTREGYVKTDPTQRTSVPHVYASGDISGGVKQITVAVGQGSVAAISAFEDLTGNKLRKGYK